MKKAVFISLVIAVLITACGPLKAARNKSFLDEFVPAYKEYMEFYIQLVEHHYNAAQDPSILYDDTWSREVIDLASGLDNAAKEINDMPVPAHLGSDIVMLKKELFERSGNFSEQMLNLATNPDDSRSKLLALKTMNELTETLNLLNTELEALTQ